ncbi:ABC transporter ATP-binding protein [Methylohalobius crimeensis]|uniref:ABC transporter ATP-binding protein n=1 Tax=Methylohalobius crimeensis TaxID=244365 RepID=UPI0003B67777|nr:ABC transporter ATP-binding protein [Methylohalobius crimeensis]
MTGNLLLRFDHVSVTVGKKAILKDLNLTLNPGEKIALKGKSGSGKSTLLKTVLGLYPLTGGTLFFLGKPLDRATIQTLRGCTAYIDQEPVLGADTVREALMLPFRFKAHRDRQPSEPRLHETLKRVRLPETILGQECRRVSGGEKQRIAVARALLLGKSLFLLDEVTSALDPVSKQAVMDVIFASSHTVLSVSHDPAWLDRCERVYELEAGHLREEKPHGYA